MSESIKMTVDLPVSPERVYRAWFDSYEFSRFTGKKAKIDPSPGGSYSHLDGAAFGQNMIVTPFNHILQTWHFRDLPAENSAPQADIRLEPTCTGCQFILNLTDIPTGYSRIVLETWENKYLRPLKNYLDELVGDYVADMDG